MQRLRLITVLCVTDYTRHFIGVGSDESVFASTELQTIRTRCKLDGEISKYKQFVPHSTVNIYDRTDLRRVRANAVTPRRLGGTECCPPARPPVYAPCGRHPAAQSNYDSDRSRTLV